MSTPFEIDHLLTGLPKLRVGDELILRDIRKGSVRPGNDVRVVVTSVGRRWGEANRAGGWQKIVFDLDTGLEKSGQYAATRRVLTPEMERDAFDRRGVLDALRKRGIEIEYAQRRTFSLATLQAILDIIDHNE